MDRRSFLASIPLLAAGAAAGCSRPAAQMGGALGLQLYTLRSVMDDPASTLATVAALGYREVELAGLYGLSPAELRRLLDDSGLRAPSSHVGLERFLPDARAELFDEALTLGHDWIVCPWTPLDERTPDGYRRLADLFDEAGEAAQALGLSVGYHNHDFEFESLEAGPSGLEILLERASPESLSFQLDLFWAVEAGEDPVDWFTAFPGRWCSVHAKDRTADGEMVAVGDGVLDFATLIDAAVAAGIDHVFVEHDQPADPLDSVTRSIRHLESLR